MSLRIGVSPWADTRAGTLRVAEAAVAAGLGTFWLGDGLLGRADFPVWSGGMETFTELAWLAGRFPGCSVAVGAAVLPLRDPLWLAKQAASLDHFTEGRFTLVVAPGFWPDEFAAEGVDFTTRGALLEEGVGLLRKLWSTTAPATGPSPPPFTPGGPPLWLAGARATMRRALRLGLPFQASRMGPAELAPWAAEWFDHGGTVLGIRIRMQLSAQVDDGTATATGAITGPAPYLAEQINAYRQLGVSDLSVMPGQDADTSVATIEAFAADVVPALARPAG
jgi:alkanesulfonate monooxygenase SsuD/methylene tetrahydromethanopterin reductase-like flavin-dependent oxidoreductase (luciferase family)